MTGRTGFRTLEIHGSGSTSAGESQFSPEVQGGILFLGDNRDVMDFLKENGYSGKLNLIYIDPPFFSNADYALKSVEKKSRLTVFSDFSDHDRNFYLSFLEERLRAMRELLSPDGSIYLHLDWHIVHYAREIMDQVFGSGHFRNEIIWHYYLGGKSQHFFARKHDTILFYTKTDRWKFNSFKVKRRLDYVPGLPARSSTGRKIADTTGKDEAGWYSIVTADDVWEIPGVFNLSGEYTGFPTQKPLALLQRIIEASTDRNDIVADFFCGSGTSMVAAQQAGRRWIGSDSSPVAVSTSMNRLMHAASDQSGTIRVLLPVKKNEDSGNSDRIRIIAGMAAGMKVPNYDGYFSGLTENGLIRITEPGSNFNSGDMDELVEKLQDSGYESAILVSDSWELKRHGNIFSFNELKRNGIELVNLSWSFLNSGNDMHGTSYASVLIHRILDFEIRYENSELKIGKFNFSEMNGPEHSASLATDSIKLWQLDRNYGGTYFSGSMDRDIWTLKSTGKSGMPEIAFNADQPAASRILFGNTGRLFTVLRM